jgi:hypothetical protein
MIWVICIYIHMYMYTYIYVYIYVLRYNVGLPGKGMGKVDLNVRCFHIGSNIIVGHTLFFFINLAEHPESISVGPIK